MTSYRNSLCNGSDFSADILQKFSINSLLEQHHHHKHPTTLEFVKESDMATPIEGNFKFGDIDSFSDMYINSASSTPTKKGHTDLQQAQPLTQNPPFQTVPGKPFERFNFDNPRVFQRNSSYDYSANTPTTPSTPSSFSANKSFQGSPTTEDPINTYDQPNFFLNPSHSHVDRSNSPPTAQEEFESQNSNFDNQSAGIVPNSLNQTQPLSYYLQTIQQIQLLQQQQLQQLPIQQFLQQIGFNKNINYSGSSGIGDINNYDRPMRYHRSFHDVSCTWSGVLPARTHRFITYSPKVFLGGIPWDISEQTLMQIFREFGEIKVEWPGKEQNIAAPKGYVYIIFETEKQVKQLLQACSLQDSLCGSNEQVFESFSSSSLSSNGSANLGNYNGNYYYKISSKRIKAKEVEVIPWIIGDSNYMKSTSPKYDPTKTVFVGGLHGKLTAEGLAKIMDDLFDGVNYVGIDTDKHKYPIGSGRVTFNNTRSYMRAVAASFIEIKTSKFTKKVQVDPYLEDSLCSVCGIQHGPYYCRELSCFRYFCRQCWQSRHTNDVHLRNHKPLTRNSKSQQIVGFGPHQSHSMNYHHQTNSLNSNQVNGLSPTSPDSHCSQNSVFDFALQ